MTMTMMAEVESGPLDIAFFFSFLLAYLLYARVVQDWGRQWAQLIARRVSQVCMYGKCIDSVGNAGEMQRRVGGLGRTCVGEDPVVIGGANA